MAAVNGLTDASGLTTGGFSLATNTCINNGANPGNTGYEEFALPNVETYTHVINRNPSVFALPGAKTNNSGTPQIYSIDFGMLEESIIIQGTVYDGYMSNPWIPKQSDLLRIGREWWSNFSLSSLLPSHFNRLSIREGPNQNPTASGPGGALSHYSGAEVDVEIYGFIFQNVQTNRVGGVLTCDYKLTLQVIFFPNQPDPDKPTEGLLWQASK